MYLQLTCRNVELKKILDRTIWNIYGIVFKRLTIMIYLLDVELKGY